MRINGFINLAEWLLGHGNYRDEYYWSTTFLQQAARGKLTNTKAGFSRENSKEQL